MSADPGNDTVARLAEIERLRVLEVPPDGEFDSIARLAATIVGTPIATVSIVDEDRIWLIATEGLDGVRQIGDEPGLCASAVLRDDPYVVNDAAVDPRTLHHPLVLGELGLRFFAAAPIVTSSGARLGTVNVIDREPREITDVQLASLTMLAAIVAEQLELRLAALHAVRAERDTANRRIAEIAEDLRRAAEAQRSRPRPGSCELGGRTGCPKAASIKVADSWGDSAWGCTRHVEQVLMDVPAVFIADESLAGLSSYVHR
ncbi:GAF domain-containing protein [Luedemannella helvata]|uniref:GAF domain-containing protein n=1 Tax=Luedemannella helvata TaxID=349315 RepID=A0ABP4WJM4_9ACTN